MIKKNYKICCLLFFQTFLVNISLLHPFWSRWCISWVCLQAVANRKRRQKEEQTIWIYYILERNQIYNKCAFFKFTLWEFGYECRQISITVIEQVKSKYGWPCSIPKPKAFMNFVQIHSKWTPGWLMNSKWSLVRDVTFSVTFLV